MAESDERYTPPWLRDVVHEFYSHGRRITDVCAPASNPMRASDYFTNAPGHDRMGPTPPVDGLQASWGEWSWCNPPYSRGQVIRWARKAIAETRTGAKVLMLTQADVSTGWFRLLRENCDQVCLMHKRVGFLKPDGSQMPGAKFGSAVWHFGHRRERFRRIWGAHGWVVEGPGVQEAEGAQHAAE